MELCKHGLPGYYDSERIDGVLIHTACGLPIECEFSDDPDDDDSIYGPPHPATHINIDYRVCDKHTGIADDLIHSRTMP